MRILISPWSKRLRNGKPNPKNYPWWTELVRSLEDLSHELVQVGIPGEEQLVSSFIQDSSHDDLVDLLGWVNTWVSVDNFFNHFGWYYRKKGVVLFGPSDPLIFGHPENLNILKGREYLRSNQFDFWESCPYEPAAFVRPKRVVEIMQLERVIP